jgi:hypothetical protein
MDEWDFEDEWEWEEEEEEEDREDLLYEWAEELADQFFLSDNNYLPNAGESYSFGFLDSEDWWPLVNQLDETVDLEAVIDVAAALDPLLGLDGIPTELLEDPLVFLETVLEGDLPPEPSGRRVGSRKLVKIALLVVRLLAEFPEAAQAAVRAWADVHRRFVGHDDFKDYDDEDEDLADLLFAPGMPPAMTGFSMMIAMTLMRWPERAEGLPLPLKFGDRSMYGEVLAQWLALPESPTVSEEGTGEAEALFAQGQLAHMLAQMGAVELMASDEIEEPDLALAYSRLSRAILWIHTQCRRCPERDGVACKVATNWQEHPVPLLDVAGEIANTSRIEGCIKM